MQRRSLLKSLAVLAAPVVSGPAVLRAAPPSLPDHNEQIRCFGHDWRVLTATDWKVDTAAGGDTLHLTVPRPQEGNPRAPIQYALLAAPPVSAFTLDVDVRSDRESASLIVVYAWRDPVHFNYVHLSTDTARKQPVHNGVFHVYGGDRVRISNDEGPAALAPATKWTAVRIVYDAATHLVETWVDGRLNTSLRAADFSLGAGNIGLGSFFDTARFRNFRWQAGARRPR